MKAPDVEQLIERLRAAALDMFHIRDSPSGRQTDRGMAVYLDAAERIIREWASEQPQAWISLERLAEAQHDIWSHWMLWFFQNDTPENRERWKRQMMTPYADLSEREKESDRKVVREFMPAPPPAAGRQG